MNDYDKIFLRKALKLILFSNLFILDMYVYEKSHSWKGKDWIFSNQYANSEKHSCLCRDYRKGCLDQFLELENVIVFCNMQMKFVKHTKG